MKALKYSTPLNGRMVLSALLGCSALVVPSIAGATASVPAKTSWAISRVASISQGSYCTMAQKYADATVLTFAKNAKGEYSLAVDFQDAHFKSGEKQTITLRPQGGAAQTYSITPQSDRTAVVGIGKDSGMMKQIAGTQMLSLEISGASTQYAMAEFETGQKELGNCIDALQTQKDKDADLVKSEKTGVSSPEAVVNRQVAVVNTTAGTGSEPSAEGLLAAKPTPAGAAETMVAASALSSADMAPPPMPVPVVAKEEVKEEVKRVAEKAPEKIVQKVEEKQPETIAWKEDPKPVVTAAVKPDAKPDAKPGNGAEKEVVALREENARLSRAMAEQRQSFENQKAAANGAAVDELRQKLETVQAENNKLRTLQTENQSLKGQLAAKSSAPAEVKDNKIQQEIETLKTENAALRNQMQAYQANQAKQTSAPQKDTSTVAADIAKLQAENAKLKEQLAAAQEVTPAPVAAPAPVVASAESEKLQKEVRDLRTQMGSVQAEKSALEAQLDKLQKETDTKQIKMAGGNWDLEQATRRYQESQREIQRLGTLVQSQQAQCTKEKKDIEYMLFDPAIAKSSQIAMLNSLEEQIAEKDKKVKAMETEMASLKAQSAPDKDKKIADLQKQLEGARTEMASKMNQAETSQNTVIASLKDQLAQKDKALFDAQAKLASAQNATAQAAQTKSVEVSAQEATITSLKTQLAETQKQLDVQRLAAQQSGAKASAEQASTLATLQMQVQQGNQKINELQNQISGLRSAALQAAAVAPAAAPAPVATPAPMPVAAPAPVAAAAPVSLAPQPQPPVQQNISFEAPKPAPAKFLSLDEFGGLLKTAGVPVSGGLQQIQGGDPSSYRAYSWKTSSLYGSVEMRQVTDPTAFDTVMGQYLARAKSRCSGEFAAVPSPVKAVNVTESKSYEIACVNAGASSSASVLFTYGNGVVMTVAHEGRAEAMDMAMDARDKIAAQLR